MSLEEGKYLHINNLNSKFYQKKKKMNKFRTSVNEK